LLTHMESFLIHVGEKTREEGKSRVIELETNVLEREQPGEFRLNAMLTVWFNQVKTTLTLY
jgi:hypothetical protein